MIENNMSFDFDLVKIALTKLSLTTLFCFIISIERQFHNHPGGICSHILVGLGSCLFTMISVYLQEKFPSNNSGDTSSIAAQIVSGFGFLGSATVYKSNNYLKGINTAANLWMSAAIGMSIGADLYELGMVATVFTVLLLLINNRYKKMFYKKKEPRDRKKGDETIEIVVRNRSSKDLVNHHICDDDCAVCAPYNSDDD